MPYQADFFPSEIRGVLGSINKLVSCSVSTLADPFYSEYNPYIHFLSGTSGPVVWYSAPQSGRCLPLLKILTITSLLDVTVTGLSGFSTQFPCCHGD